MNIEPVFVPKKNDEEKLQSIDRSVESCIEIIRQEFIKKAELSEEPHVHMHLAAAVDHLNLLQMNYQLTKM